MPARSEARTGMSESLPRLCQVRFHGRGGQGVVTAAELLSVAAFLDGKQAQAFPSFGSERMGAPVVSYCRISATPIRVREPVFEPDAVVSVDATLLHHVDVFAGLAADGYVLINSPRSPEELGLTELANRIPAGHVVTVPASEIARQHIGRPLPNVALLGAFAALTEQVTRKSIEVAVNERFPAAIAAANVRTARAAFDAVPEGSHA
jgi:pyruvate ferredoxin oxidoreductase gamma subunit